MTNTPDEMKALERVERRLNNTRAKHGFMTLAVSDLREVVSLARASSRPADQVPDMVEALKTTTTHLIAAISLLRKIHGDLAPSKKHALFSTKLADYEKASEKGRETLAALQAVPASGEEPTQAMVEAGCQQWTSWGHAEPVESVVKRIYAAMRAASGEE